MKPFGIDCFRSNIPLRIMVANSLTGCSRQLDYKYMMPDQDILPLARFIGPEQFSQGLVPQKQVINPVERI